MQILSKHEWSAGTLQCAQQSNHLNKINPSTKFMLSVLPETGDLPNCLRNSHLSAKQAKQLAPNGNSCRCESLFCLCLLLKEQEIKNFALFSRCSQIVRKGSGVHVEASVDSVGADLSSCLKSVQRSVSAESWLSDRERWKTGSMIPWASLAADSVMILAVGRPPKRFAYLICVCVCVGGTRTPKHAQTLTSALIFPVHPEQTFTHKQKQTEPAFVQNNQ